MISKYDVGDTVILRGTVERIEQTQDETILYTMKEYRIPIPEEAIVGRVEAPWELKEIIPGA